MTTDFRPYLIKATYDWLCANDAKIFIKVNTLYSPLDVPSEYIDEHGTIVLNVSISAVGAIDTSGIDDLSVTIRFDGELVDLTINYNAIDAMYDANSGKGNAFERMKNKLIKKDDVKKTHRTSNLRLVD